MQAPLDVFASLKTQFAGLQVPGNSTLLVNSIVEPTMRFFEEPKPVSDPVQREELEYIRSTARFPAA